MVTSALIHELHSITGLSTSLLERFCEQDRLHYYRYVAIEKKNGKPRRIFIPTAELRMVQNVIKERYLSKLPCSKCATAYIKGSNVLKNAQAHRRNSHFLFMDIRHFFDSIPFDRLFRKLQQEWSPNVLDEGDVGRLLRICSRNRVFVQGCVTSPALSNYYMVDFDNRMLELIKDLPNGKYTRYSDDIIVSSSERIPQELALKIAELLGDFGLSVNGEKTKFVSSMDRAFITGVHLTSDGRFVLSTKYKKMIKKEIYDFITSQNRTPKMRQRIAGLMGYLKMVDPHYYHIVNNKYAQEGVALVDYLRQLAINVDQ